ncbi:hypothetical protein K469DRAFT_798882 [Zopfia rhizophila CBS 207.26]|uniref:Uncharacterized protein n=1 Tax=Zopfia rhizophila CBS 207.26 TaxID=1314779 RepID=A0A6A6DNH1_9PEZI|nr:hypothetical protein K469DRAFT_798882 [Zopfia rhizophila CBS 207.26]
MFGSSTRHSICTAEVLGTLGDLNPEFGPFSKDQYHGRGREGYVLFAEAAKTAGVISTTRSYEPTSGLRVRVLNNDVDWHDGIPWYRNVYGTEREIEDVTYDEKFCQLLRAGIEDPLVVLFFALLPNHGGCNYDKGHGELILLSDFASLEKLHISAESWKGIPDQLEQEVEVSTTLDDPLSERLPSSLREFSINENYVDAFYHVQELLRVHSEKLPELESVTIGTVRHAKYRQLESVCNVGDSSFESVNPSPTFEFRNIGPNVFEEKYKTVFCSNIPAYLMHPIRYIEGKYVHDELDTEEEILLGDQRDYSDFEGSEVEEDDDDDLNEDDENDDDNDEDEEE